MLNLHLYNFCFVYVFFLSCIMIWNLKLIYMRIKQVKRQWRWWPPQDIRAGESGFVALTAMKEHLSRLKLFSSSMTICFDLYSTLQNALPSLMYSNQNKTTSEKHKHKSYNKENCGWENCGRQSCGRKICGQDSYGQDTLWTRELC